MKIVILSTTYPVKELGIIGGSFVKNEAEALAAAGNQVTVITPHRFGAKSREQVNERLTVRRFAYFFPKKLQKLKDPKEPAYKQKSFLSLIQMPIVMFLFGWHALLNIRRVDVFYCQWTITSLPVIPLKWLFGIPVVQVARGSDIRLLPKKLNTFIHKNVTTSVDTYGLQEWNENYKREFPYKFIKLPLLIDIKNSEAPEDIRDELSYSFNILYVSRFNDELISIYGHPTIKLLYSINELKKRGFDLHLTYIGDGDPLLKKEITDIIDKYGLEGHVKLLGFKNNVLDYMPHFDLGVGGSAFSTVSQEFSMNKIPQILAKGFDNVGTPWQDRVNSYFFEFEDQSSLTTCIEEAITNKEERQEIGNMAYKMMSNWVADLDKGGKIYTQKFQEILKP